MASKADAATKYQVHVSFFWISDSLQPTPIFMSAWLYAHPT